MKVILFTILSSILFFSCEKNELTPDTSTVPLTKSASIPNPLDQLEGIPVNIKVVGTVQKNNNFLSANDKKNIVHRHSVDDGSLRQRWYLTKYNGVALGNAYTIKVAGGAKVNGKISLKGGPDQYNLVLDANDLPGLYFNIESIANTSNYNISMKNFSNILYLYAKGSEKDLIFSNSVNRSDPRAIWEIVPVENLELLDIKYIPVTGKKFNPALSFRGTRKVENNTDSPITHTMLISEIVKESSSFSKTEGLSVTNKISIKTNVGLPLISNGEVSAEQTTAKTWTFQESNTTERQRTIQDTFVIIVSPYSNYYIDVNIISYNIDVDYVATFKGVNSGKIIYLKGKWNGVECTGIDYKAHDLSGNPINIQGLRNLKL